MKKSPIRLLVALAAVCVVFAGASCVRAVSGFVNVRDHMDRSQLAMLRDEERMNNILKKREKKSRKKRNKALDKKRAEEAQATPAPTTEDTAASTPEATDAPDETNSFAEVSNGHIIGIDPGHQGSWVDMTDMEPNAPGSSEMKVRCTTGTTGNYTGLEEYQLNLDVSMKLRDILEARGYRVVMTREDNDANISNAERAQKVAAEGAEIYVRIHANSSDDSSVSGALTMCPSSTNPYVSELYDSSYRLAETILNAYCAATGIGNRGVMLTDTMTGINWSSVPVTIVEMGFMSNQGDDTAMADDDFQQTMAEGIANGIDAYFGSE